MSEHRPSESQRAQGRPDAGCTRGLVCSVESTRVSHHRFNRSDPAFPAQWCYGVVRAPPGVRDLIVTVTPRVPACRARQGRHREPARLSTSPGVPGPHASAVRVHATRQSACSRPSHLRLAFVTPRTPLSPRRDGGHKAQIPLFVNTYFRADDRIVQIH